MRNKLLMAVIAVVGLLTTSEDLVLESYDVIEVTPKRDAPRNRLFVSVASDQHQLPLGVME